MSTTMHIYVGRNRAGFEDAGMPTGEYVRRTQQRYGQEAADQALHRYAVAAVAAASHPAWIAHRLSEPAVLYNAEVDEIYFVLPIGHDGPIFFVSGAPIRPLERWARLRHDGHDYQSVELQAGIRA
jgi:hypothetical protein